MTIQRMDRILKVLILSACMSAVSALHADGNDSLWEYSLNSAQQCQGAINSSVESAADCFLGDGINSLFKKGISLSDQRLKESLGENFSITGTMNWSPDVGSTGGLDMVTPFSFAGSAGTDAAAGIRSATFLQQGVTRWRDGFGTMRNDMRNGVVHRFRVSDSLDSDVIGLSSFHLRSTEHGHEVLALGMDYFGRWGTGELRYYAPTTDWTVVRPGHEERPLEGMELGTRLNLTTTLDLSVTGYQWEAEDGSGDMNRGTRLGFNWRPHSWLSFDTTWDGGSDDAMSVWMNFNMPFGPGTEKPRWEWLGVAGSGNSGNTNMFQAVPEIGHIRVASRSARIASSAGSNGVSARFVEPSVDSGETVTIEVFTEESAQRDIKVTVRLEPGATEPSAVPGVDFVDRPMEATITQGTTSTVVSFPILLNEAMQEPRSLGVSVSVSS